MTISKPFHHKNPLLKNKANYGPGSHTQLPNKSFIVTYDMNKTEGFLSPLEGDEPCDMLTESRPGGGNTALSSNVNSDSLPIESFFINKRSIQVKKSNPTELSIKMSDNLYNQSSELLPESQFSNQPYYPYKGSTFQKYTVTNSQMAAYNSSIDPSNENMMIYHQSKQDECNFKKKDQLGENASNEQPH